MKTASPIRYCRPLLASAREHYSEKSCRMIADALRIAVRELADLRRYNGEPFVVHSIDTARIVCGEIGLGRNSVISTLLHDVLRLGRMEMSQVEARFGAECVTLLRGMNHISAIDPKQAEEQVDNFRELILSYATDPRVILIKLADRLEVMRTLGSFPAEKQEKKAWEALHLYAEIAHKLGLYAVKSELEDLALKYLHPDEYGHILQKLSETGAERQAFIARFVAPIEAQLQRQGIEYTLKSRTKSVYSIWKKMKASGISFDEVYDVFAIRFILDCARELEKQTCWAVYSIVTDFYTPNPARMRDWITIPKSNGYESLHATVSAEGKWVEVQIRTRRMDEVAERGVAAHWRYKGVSQGGLSSEAWLAKLRELMETAENTTEIPRTIEPAEGPDEVFVFTPNGDLRKLRAGATVLDFAFDIHSRIGSTCTGARINDKVVPIREKLRNGDVVEIITSKNQRPKADWLHIVATGKARQRIKVFLREEQAKAASLGRETLERKLKNWKIAAPIDDVVTLLCKRYKVKTGTELYALIAGEKVSFAEIKELVSAPAPGPILPEKSEGKSRVKKKESDTECLVIDDTLRQVSYKFGKCCRPIYGDEVFGFVTVSAGITIHRQDCPNGARLKELYPYRVLEAKWRDDARTGSFRATVRLIAADEAGLLNRITEVITGELKVNIRSISLVPARGEVEGTINIEVTSSQLVGSVVHALLRVKGVQKVYRV